MCTRAPEMARAKGGGSGGSPRSKIHVLLCAIPAAWYGGNASCWAPFQRQLRDASGVGRVTVRDSTSRVNDDNSLTVTLSGETFAIVISPESKSPCAGAGVAGDRTRRGTSRAGGAQTIAKTQIANE